MKFYSKAQTLSKLKIKGAIIPNLLIFWNKDFKKDKKKVLQKISKTFKKERIIIRSSSLDEDNSKTSNAGKFKSFLNVDPSNFQEVESKINKVLESYKSNKKNEFFVQAMVKNIGIAGVILTRNLSNFAKCISINYSEDKSSSTVTSGKEGSKVLVYFENKKFSISKKFSKVYEITKKLRNKFKNQELDIEFIIDKKNNIYLIQVRKLIVPKKITKDLDNQSYLLKGLEKKIEKLKKQHYALYGKTTHFGVMPDWNPAEIIGTKPKPLAISLYQELITDHIWAENRRLYGYKDLSQFHLMTNFFGTPYIDVRIDFNSWIPKNLDNKISEKVVNFYLKKFKSNVDLHDKVEFEILFTCFNPSTAKKINQELFNTLKKNERNKFVNSLKEINKIALEQQKKDLLLLDELKKRQIKIEKSNLYFIDKIYWIIEDCKKFGTLPFAGLARCAFIAMDMLNSFVSEKIITEEDKIKFLSKINTITSEMESDLSKGKSFFVKKYGHLRPGTYEITSENYRSRYDLYFGKKKYLKNNKKTQNYKFSSSKKKKIEKFIKKNGIYKNYDQLMSFIKDSIKNREYAKFIFTKSIDQIFSNLNELGKKYKISREDLSFLDIQKILKLYFDYSNFKSIKSLKTNITQNKNEYYKNYLINLPDVINEGKDLFIQKKLEAKINFISNKIIRSKIINYEYVDLINSLDGIVCIENADPGYDFIFSKNIKGLVTKYGGQNSHMAIRCAEKNMPALIGVGEKLYNEIVESKFININCVEKKIDLIK
tara:strand:- start:3658 stop:5961 length:2304 start_codon:yes stop_codon:yes gene_type:complete